MDLKLYKDGEVALVQCKQWKMWRVGVSAICEFYGVLMAEKAARGIFITSGSFTQEAWRFADGIPMELINGPALVRLIGLPAAPQHQQQVVVKAAT